MSKKQQYIPTKDSRAEAPSLIHYKTGKHSFEVALAHEPGLLDEYRAHPSPALLTKVVETDKVYTSFQKGQVASTEELRSVFDVKSNNEIIDIILREGTVHVAVGEKRAAAAAHRDAVVAYLLENYVNKSTRLPIEPATLNSAIEENKVHIPDGDVASSAAATAHALLAHRVNLKEGDITGSIEMKSELVGPAEGVIHKYSRIKNESQTMFGDEFKYRISIKPGDYAAFRQALDKATKGQYQFVLGQVELHAEESASSSSSRDHDHAALKKEERENAKAVQIAEAVVKQEQKQNKQAEEARARKQGATEE